MDESEKKKRAAQLINALVNKNKQNHEIISVITDAIRMNPFENKNNNAKLAQSQQQE